MDPRLPPFVRLFRILFIPFRQILRRQNAWSNSHLFTLKAKILKLQITQQHFIPKTNRHNKRGRNIFSHHKTDLILEK